MQLRISILVLLFLLLATHNKVQAQIELTDTTNIYRVDKQIEILIDSKSFSFLELLLDFDFSTAHFQAAKSISSWAAILASFPFNL